MKKKKLIVDAAVGAKIRMLRIAEGYSVEEISEEIGLTAQEFREGEEGNVRFSAKTLFELCRLLDTNSSEIFSGLKTNLH